MKPTFWLRSETKEFEKRTALTPKNAKKLIDKGCEIVVERFSDRIFKDTEYEEVGCKIVESGSWIYAPSEAIIFGLKELPDEDYSLKHRHILFAHCYKGQDGAEKILKRFKNGGGKLFDLEYLTNDEGRRIAAFGKWAGFVGAAVAVDAFAHNQLGRKLPPLHFWPNKGELFTHLNGLLDEGGKRPTAMIFGSKGRCGFGANELLTECGITATGWDYEETKIGGPFKEICDYDIFINAALITKKIPPFINESVMSEGQKLKYIADVSCDPTSDLNPIPLYDDITSWEKPLVKYKGPKSSIDILAVDNLPSVLPKESSEDFSDQLFPFIESFVDEGEESMVWNNALNVFKKFTK